MKATKLRLKSLPSSAETAEATNNKSKSTTAIESFLTGTQYSKNVKPRKRNLQIKPENRKEGGKKRERKQIINLE